MIAMSVCFLVLSFSSSDNEVLRLLGESPDRTSNDHLERKVQYTFISISFLIMVTGSLGLTASYSLEHCMAYLVSLLVTSNTGIVRLHQLARFLNLRKHWFVIRDFELANRGRFRERVLNQHWPSLPNRPNLQRGCLSDVH